MENSFSIEYSLALQSKHKHFHLFVTSCFPLNSFHDMLLSIHSNLLVFFAYIQLNCKLCVCNIMSSYVFVVRRIRLGKKFRIIIYFSICRSEQLLKLNADAFEWFELKIIKFKRKKQHITSLLSILLSFSYPLL